MEKEMKVAVLIDAENISGKYVNVILSEANSLGNVTYKRIYGDWTSSQMGNWKTVVLDNSIQPIQQYRNVSGKNSSDSSLIIDAMDLLYQGRVGAFCIVSSDSDFTRLASRLRESEMFVLGMGEQKTPRSFISACNKFSYLDLLYAASLEEAAPPAPAEQPAASGGKKNKGGKKQPAAKPPKKEENGSNLDSVRAALRELTEENSNDDGWIYSGKLGFLLSKRFPDFDVRNFGFKKFASFVRSLNCFQTKELADDESETSKRIYFKLK
ncbi:NYN domain-containing protein [Dysosmobacter sp.]|uniref:NYN domain-containing protein n=1 Tax=Dysosmobacter sp. TaxID=2591382 RepID=UPI002A88AC7C|nr:NYN domain-containing protein [Dysosmobacter sp.]MDY3282572.1 NYN domain-containing protein [Dysosmobacter sp.]